MADDLNGLGTAAVWRPDFLNWRQAPTWDFEFSRYDLSFVGTKHLIQLISTNLPYSFAFLVTVKNLSKQYAVIEKFYELQGRHKRFWFLNPQNLFTLATASGEGTASLIVKYTGFEFGGYERIYLLMKDGDLLTHAITGVTHDEENGVTTIALGTTLDRTISPGSYIFFSLLHLCRLDIDVLELDYKSMNVAEANVRAVEVIEEYSEI